MSHQCEDANYRRYDQPKGVPLRVTAAERANGNLVEVDPSESVPFKTLKQNPNFRAFSEGKFGATVQQALAALVGLCFVGMLFSPVVGGALAAVGKICSKHGIGMKSYHESTNKRFAKITNPLSCTAMAIKSCLEGPFNMLYAAACALLPAGAAAYFLRLNIYGPTTGGAFSNGVHADAHQWWSHPIFYAYEQVRLVIATATGTICFIVVVVDGNGNIVERYGIFGFFEVTLHSMEAYVLNGLASGQRNFGYMPDPDNPGEFLALRVVHAVPGVLAWRTALLLTVLLPSVEAGAAWINSLRTTGMAQRAAAQAAGTAVSNDVAEAAAVAYRQKQEVDLKFALEAARVARNEALRERYWNDAEYRERYLASKRASRARALVAKLGDAAVFEKLRAVVAVPGLADQTGLADIVGSAAAVAAAAVDVASAKALLLRLLPRLAAERGRVIEERAVRRTFDELRAVVDALVPDLEGVVGLEAIVGRAAVDVAAAKALLVRIRTYLDAEQRRRLAEDPEYAAVVAEDERARQLEATCVRYWSQHGGEDARRAFDAYWRRMAQEPEFRAGHLQRLDSLAEQARLRERARQQAWRASRRLASGQAPQLASYRPHLTSSQHAFREYVSNLKSRLSIPSGVPIPRVKLTPVAFKNLKKKFAEAYPRWPPFPFDPYTMMIYL